MSRTVKLLGALITLSALGLSAGSAFAQAWPTKPVRVIVALPPGSGTDITGRAVAASLAAQTGQPFSGLWYTVAITAMAFIVALIWLPETSGKTDLD